MRRVPVTLLLLLLALGLPARAGADGDPASDVLLGADTFLPYADVATPDARRLDATTAVLAKHGIPLRVAVIAAPVDLGAIPQLFGKPQAYARFLSVELSYYGPHRPLLVVMPAGYGTVHLSATSAAAVSAVARPDSAAPGALMRAAVDVEARIAHANGFSLPAASGAVAAAAGLGHGRLPIIVGLGTVALLGAVGLVWTSGWRRRRA